MARISSPCAWKMPRCASRFPIFGRQMRTQSCALRTKAPEHTGISREARIFARSPPGECLAAQAALRPSGGICEPNRALCARKHPNTRESRLWREFARSPSGECPAARVALRSPSGKCEPNRALCARNGFATGQQKEDGVALLLHPLFGDPYGNRTHVSSVRG